MSCSGEPGEEGQPAAHLPGQSRARAAHSPLRVRRADTPAMPGMTRMRTAGLLPARGACSLASPGRREGQDALCTGSGSKWSECLQGRPREGGGRGRAEGGGRGGGGPRTQRGPGPNGSGQEAALPLCNTRGGKRKPRKSPFFPPPQGAELKKKPKSIMEAKLPWNLTLLPLHFWVSGTQAALLWFADHAFFFFPFISFFFPSLLKVVLQLCIYTLHITSLITIITAHINRPGVVSPFYSTRNGGSEGLNNGLWLPK